MIQRFDIVADINGEAAYTVYKTRIKNNCFEILIWKHKALRWMTQYNFRKLDYKDKNDRYLIDNHKYDSDARFWSHLGEHSVW